MVGRMASFLRSCGRNFYLGILSPDDLFLQSVTSFQPEADGVHDSGSGPTLLFNSWLPVFSSSLPAYKINARLHVLVLIPGNFWLQRMCCVLVCSCVNWGETGIYRMEWLWTSHALIHPKSPSVQWALNRCYCYECCNCCQLQFIMFPKVQNRKSREEAICKMEKKMDGKVFNWWKVFRHHMQRTILNRINKNKFTPWRIMRKLQITKDQEKICKSIRFPIKYKVFKQN